MADACLDRTGAWNDQTLIDRMSLAGVRCHELGLCPTCEAVTFLLVAFGTLKDAGISFEEAAIVCANVAGKIYDTAVGIEMDMDTEDVVSIDEAVDLFRAYAQGMAEERVACGRLAEDRAAQVAEFDVTTFRASLGGAGEAAGRSS